MPSYLLRTSRDEPAVYVMWSDVVESPTFIGDRAEAVEWLKQYESRCPEPCCVQKQVYDRLDRADRTGTSAHPGFYAYDDDGLIYAQKGVLPRECLAAFTTTLFEQGEDAALAYVQPFEDELTASPVSSVLPVGGLEDGAR